MTKSRQIAPPRRPWAPDEVALLCARYAEHRTADIAAQLGRPLKHVYSKATRLGLRKSAAFLQRDVSGRMLKGGALIVATQFKPGSVPWNKGKHYEALGRSIDTQFKPGGTPHTWKPIGSLRINADGYLQRKCSDTRYPPRDWVSIHRSVWEAKLMCEWCCGEGHHNLHGEPVEEEDLCLACDGNGYTTGAEFETYMDGGACRITRFRAPNP